MSYLDPPLYTTSEYERYRDIIPSAFNLKYPPEDAAAAYRLLELRREEPYVAAAMLEMNQGRQGFGDEHEGPPAVVRQNAVDDPNSIMHEFRPMSFGKAKKTKKPRKAKPKKVSLKQLQAIARNNGVSIFTRRKDGKGFTKKPLTVKALKSRLSRRKVPYQSGPRPGPLRGDSFKVFSTPFRPGLADDDVFYDAMEFGAGHDFVCPPGMKRNKKWRPKSRKHRRKCLKDKGPRVTLSELQNIARENRVSIFTLRKDGKGFTKKPLSVKALKSRLSRKKVPYRGGRRLGPLARPDDGYLPTLFRPGI
tara:strand:+ start:1239 stop:2156 length:918 start_codon:yes stop_codon:yes gene_type:complete